jgi:hypothetical protein
MSRFIQLVGAFAWIAVSLAAAPPDPWIKITSANFELYTTAGENSGRNLVRHFEQVRSFFLQAFGGGLKNVKPARIIAFRDEKEYQPYRPNDFAAAYYQSGTAHDFIVMSHASIGREPVAVHEFTHLMVHQSGLELPPWLNEGLAEVYSNLEPRGSKVLVGQAIAGRMQALRTERWIPLTTLLAVDHASPYYNEKARAGMFYAESWALVHMFYLGPEYRSHMSALAAAIKDGDPQTAVAKTMGKPIEEIDDALRHYLYGLTIRVELFDVQLPKSIDTPEIETSAALPARLALAELLSNLKGRNEQARSAFEQLATEYPNRWEVEEALGEYAWKQRKLADSARHFARAVELGCKNLDSLLLYARVLGYDNQPAREAEILRKTLELYPESNEASLELGAALVRTGNYGAALAALLDVKKVSTPEQAYQLFYNIAYVRYRLGDLAHAREILVKARSFAKNPGQIASLDSLEQALDRPSHRVASDGAPSLDGADDSGLPPIAVASKRPTVEGQLERMECGDIAKLLVRVGASTQIFLIPDPAKVVIHSGTGKAVEMQCGEQKPPRPIRIEYEAPPDGETGAIGRAVSLEFQ